MPPPPAAAAPDFEDGGQTPPPADDAGLWAGFDDGAEPPDLPEPPRRVDPNAERHRGQLRFATRFTDRYAGVFLHAHGLGWHLWDGIRWAFCEDGAPLRAIERLANDAYTDLPLIPDAPGKKNLLADIKSVSGANGASGALEFAGSMHPCTIAGRRVDVRPELFNTETCTLDLKTGEIHKPDPADHLTRRADARFEPDARFPEWDKFISQIQPDVEMRGFLQRLFGSAMYGAVREHRLPIFTGTGQNGKGVLRSTMLAAFGDYAREVDPELLMESKHPRHLTFLMDLKSMRLVFASETKRNRQFDEATMKRLVGGDPIEANKMRQDPITFEPSHTLIMVTNHLPIVSGDDPAVWRRLIVVPFDVVIDDDAVDVELPDRLATPDARAAVLAWVWQGWLDYQKYGLQPPGAVVQRTEKYKAESDQIGNFINDACMVLPHAHTRAGDLFHAWQKWCSENGVDPGTAKAFSTSLSNRGYRKETRNFGALYIGIGLYAEDDEDAQTGPQKLI
jgi:putative DNA primase/helicase